jgi:hypothetical protein
VLSSPNFCRHALYTDDDHVRPEDFPYHIPTVNQKVWYDLKTIYSGDKSSTALKNRACQPWTGPMQGAHADFCRWYVRVASRPFGVLRLFRFVVVDMQCLPTTFHKMARREFITNAIEHCRRGHTRHHVWRKRMNPSFSRLERIGNDNPPILPQSRPKPLPHCGWIVLVFYVRYHNGPNATTL